MADIQYLNYGDLQIDLLAFLTKAANEVQGYVQKLPWSKKRKEKFMSAYSDLMNRGIQGASNGTGQWMIDVGGDALPFDTMDKKDREMYQEAAYFIQQQMAGLPTKASLEEDEKKKEEEEKKDLPLFDNKYFTEGLHSYISDNEFGGLPWSLLEHWNPLDERDSKTGLRGTNKRAALLAKYLRLYGDSLDETKLNFEGSPFKNLNDFKTRLNTAITELENGTWNQADKDALNKLGLNPNTYFYNGGDDTLTSGDFTGTYNLYYNEYLPLLQKTKQDAVIAQQKAARANQYDNYRFLNFLNGTPGTEEEFNLIGLKLAGQQKLDGNDVSRISWAFRQGMKSGGLENLSKEELAKFGPRYTGTPNRLKKLPGLEGIYYDSIANRLIQPFKGLQLTGATLSGILAENSPENLAKKEQENKLKAANRELSKGWETEDYLRMGAMALDIAGAVTAWGGPFGMAISGGLGLTSLGTNMAADIADESMSKWDVVKNAGVNLGLAAVGMVPGLGLASKTGKWLTTIARWAPRLLTIQALKDTPEVYASIKKAVDNPSKVTNLDWKNIAYGLSIAAGLSRGAKGIVNNRKFKPTVSQTTEKEAFITTKSGKKITATEELVKAINKAGKKGGNDKANEELRKLPGAENEEVNINFKTGIKGKADPTNRIKLEHSTKNIGQTSEVLRYSRALSIKNIRDKAKHPILSRYLPTDYDIYQNATHVNAPNIDFVNRFKQAWNPVSNRPFKGTKNNLSSTNNSPTSTPTGSNAKPKQPVLSKTESLEIKSTLKGKNFSNNEFKDESRVVGSIKGFGDLYGVRNTDGTHTLQIDFGGTRINVTGTKADIKGKTLEVLRKDVMKKIDTLIPKEKRSRIKFELIKQLKQNGYLKQGGTIDRQRIQNYKEFINK